VGGLAHGACNKNSQKKIVEKKSTNFASLGNFSTYKKKKYSLYILVSSKRKKEKNPYLSTFLIL